MTDAKRVGYIIFTDGGVAHPTETPFYDGWHKPLAKTFCGIRYRSGLNLGGASTEKPDARICRTCLKTIAFKVHFSEQARANEAAR